MATIADLRKRYPNLRDDELVHSWAQVTGQAPDQAAYNLGLDATAFQQDDPGFVSAAQNSIYGMAGSLGQVGQDLTGGAVGQSLEEFGDRGQYRNPVTLMEGESDSAFKNVLTNFADKPVNSTMQALGVAAGFMGPQAGLKTGLAGYRALRGVQAAAAPSRMASAAGAAGNAAYYGLPSYGSIRDVQEVGGHNDAVDMLAAGTGALTVGALEGRFGPEAWLSRGVNAGIGGPGKNFLRTGLKTGMVEGAEEMAQTPVERAASYEDVLSMDTLDQMAAGGVVGFAAGAPMGMAAHPFMKKPMSTVEERDLLAPAGSGPQQMDILGQYGAPRDMSEPLPEEPMGPSPIAADPYARDLSGQMSFLDQMYQQGDSPTNFDQTVAADPYYGLDAESQAFQNRQGGVSGYRSALEGAPGTFENVTPRRDFAIPGDRQYGPVEQTPEEFMQEQGITPPVVPTPDARIAELTAALKNKQQPLAPKAAENARAELAALQAQQKQMPKQGTSVPNAGMQPAAHAAPKSPIATVRETVRANGVSPKAWTNFVSKYGLAAPGVTPDKIAESLRDRAVNGRAGSTEAWEAAHVALTGESISDYLNRQEQLVPGPTAGVSPAAATQQGVFTPEAQATAEAAPADNREAERATVRNILAKLSDRQQLILGKYHFDKMSFEAIGEQMAQDEGRDKPYTRAYVQQEHKRAKQKLLQHAKSLGLTEDRLNTYFPDESVRVSGGADVRTAGASEVAQMGTAMHVPGGVDYTPTGEDDVQGFGKSDVVVDEDGNEIVRADAEAGALEIGQGQDEFTDDDLGDQGEVLAEEVMSDLETEIVVNGVVPSDTGLTIEDAEEEWENSRIPAHGDPVWKDLSAQQKQQWTNLFFRWDEGTEGVNDNLLETGRRMIANAAKREGKAGAQVDGRAADATGAEVPAGRAQNQDQQNPVERPAARAEEGAGPAAGAADEVAPKGALETRVDALRQKLGEKQSARLDKLIARFQGGEIDRARFDDELAALEEQAGKGMLYAEGGKARGQDAGKLREKMRKLFVSPALFDRRIVVVQSPAELPPGMLEAEYQGYVQGFYDLGSGKVYLIADNIPTGRELGVFLHEVGAHMGMRDLLGKQNFERLYQQITKWADGTSGRDRFTGRPSIENMIASKAVGRVLDAMGGASGDMSDWVVKEEMVAYFIEEAVNAGINPTAVTSMPESLRQWFTTLWNAVKAAVQKLGVNPARLTAQDVVDLAYGAARLQLSGSKADLQAANVTTGRPAYPSPEMEDAGKLNSWAERDGFMRAERLRVWYNRLQDLHAEGELYEDGDTGKKAFDAVMAVSNPSEQSILRMLWKDDMLGFDYPHQAIRAIIEDPGAYDMSNELKAALTRASGKLNSVSGTVGYHGTKSFFPIGDFRSHDLGVHFGTSEQANNAANRWGTEQSNIGKRRMIKAELGVENPLRLTEPENGAWHNPYAVMRVLDDAGISIPDPARKFITALGQTRSVSVKENNDAKMQALGALRRAIERAGYDGVVYDNKHEGAGDSYIVFDTAKLKPVYDVMYSVAPAETMDKVYEFGAKIDFGNRWNEVTPKLMTLHQLKDWFGDKLKHLADYVQNFDKMSMAQQRIMQDGHKVTQEWVKLHKSTQKALHKVMLDATMEGMHPDLEFADELNKHLGADQRAGFDALKARYDAMPADAKAVYQAAKKQLDENWKKRREIFADVVTAAYDKRIAERDPKTEADEIANLEKERDRAIRDHDNKIKEIKGPYFPLMRFGDYVVVSRSAEMQALEKQLEEAKGEELKALQKQHAKMRTEGRHYRAEAFQSLAVAERRAAQLRTRGYAGVETFKGEQFNRQFQPFAASGLEHINHMVDAAFGTNSQDRAAANKMKDLMNEVYISAMPEHAALQRQLKREGIEGASDEMLRAFGEVMEKDAFFLSRMQYSKELADNMFHLKREAREAGVKYQHVYDNLQQRVALDFSYRQTPVQDMIAKASGIFHLGIAPAFLLTNMTQPWMITVPQLAGRHGMGKTFAAMRNAWVDSGRVIKQGKGGVFNLKDLDFEALPEGPERDMLKHVAELGQLDITQTADMGLLAEGTPPALYKGMKVFNWATHHIELHNRVSTALAAFRLEMAKDGTSYETARDAAYDAVVRTQLDYSGTNAAYFMKQGVGPLGNMNKLIFQFRKYQQGMVYLLIRDAKLAFAGDKGALKSLAYLMGMQIAMAGAAGVPLFAPMLLLLSLGFDDDDERGDPETWLRNLAADAMGEDAARTFFRGLPTMLGLDVSNNLGMGSLFKPFPMIRTESVTDARSGRDAVQEVLYNVPGAWLGMVGGVIDAGITGDVSKAMPRFVRNPMKAGQYATEGLKTRSGEQVFGADEFDGWDLAYRTLGFSTVKESEHYTAKQAKESASRSIKERRDGLLRDYAQARLRGESTADIEREVQLFNADHPDRDFRITRSSLLRATKARKDRAKDTDENGVTFRRNEGSLRDITRFAG